MTLTGSDLTLELQKRLCSSEDLSKRCNFAVRTLRSPVFIPNKLYTILLWFLDTLDKKYKTRITEGQTEESMLWYALLSCLQHIEESRLHIDVSRVSIPEILSNLLPHTDLCQPCVASSVVLLLSQSLPSHPSHPLWPGIFSTVLVSPAPENLHLLQALLNTMQIDPLQDNVKLVSTLCRLHEIKPHNSYIKTTKLLLFPTGDPYIQLFDQLTGCEGKYNPGHVVSLLLSLLTTTAIPTKLVLESCPDQPVWLKPKLFSLLLSCCGCPGFINDDSVIGARILSETTIFRDIGGLFRVALPLDLSVELRSGYHLGEYLSDIVTYLAAEQGLSTDLKTVVKSLHTHHPQLLEPLVSILTIKLLEDNQDGNLEFFSHLLDVQIKLRQVPKIISKLFLHLRKYKKLSDLCWNPLDLQLLGTSITSLPKVQSLEMWKSLNYHFSSDVLDARDESKVDPIACVLGPIFHTVLVNSELADHNLPSTLVKRIEDLLEDTLLNLEKLKSKANMSTAEKMLHSEVSSAIAELGDLFVKYRKNGVSTSSSNAAEHQHSSTARSTQLSSPKKDLLQEIEYCPDLLDSLPETSLLQLIEEEIPSNSSLLESLNFCSRIIFRSLTVLNKDETLFIPEFDHWRLESFSQLNSYLGKSISTALSSVLHSEEPKYSLPAKYLQKLRQLPLEHLPTVLKLSSSLIFIALLLCSEKGDEKDMLELECCRCLETTDLFRFIDAGMFLSKLLCLNVGDEMLEVVCKSAGRFTKSITDLEIYFEELEKNDVELKASMFILKVQRRMLNEGTETDKNRASKILADRILKFVLVKFEKRNLENRTELDIFCQLSGYLVDIYAKKEPGKLSTMLSTMVNLSLDEKCNSWEILLKSVCNNLLFLYSFVPQDWREKSFKMLVDENEFSDPEVLRALLKTATAKELESMMQFLSEKNLVTIKPWIQIIQSEVDESCVTIKRFWVEKAVRRICSDIPNLEHGQLSNFFKTIFTSSPPCISQHAEISCLGCLQLLPPHLLSGPLSVFISHRSNLSTKVIPIISSIIRQSISQCSVTVEEMNRLQKVLGLLPRHKTDYVPVISYVIADLLHFLHSLPTKDRGLLTIPIYPLLDLLEKHSLAFLSSNLPPATNELFKLIFSHYNISHKFKGKV